MNWGFSLAGFWVGLLVGLTGVGGAALMTPFLILIGGIRPVVAVGTDLIYAAITKAVGALVHYRQRTVDVTIASYLGIGSIPGALLGVGLIGVLRGASDNGAVDRLLSRALGLVLIIVALSLLLRPWSKPTRIRRDPYVPVRGRRGFVIALGAGIGFLVGLTSVGSGSLIAASLVTVYPELPLRRVVGTDIFHAAFLSAIAGLAHFGLGTVDWRLVASLLVGSIPGVWVGSRLAAIFPGQVLRPLLAALLLGTGYKLL